MRPVGLIHFLPEAKSRAGSIRCSIHTILLPLPELDGHSPRRARLCRSLPEASTAVICSMRSTTCANRERRSKNEPRHASRRAPSTSWSTPSRVTMPLLFVDRMHRITGLQGGFSGEIARVFRCNAQSASGAASAQRLAAYRSALLEYIAAGASSTALTSSPKSDVSFSPPAWAVGDRQQGAITGVLVQARIDSSMAIDPDRSCWVRPRASVAFVDHDQSPVRSSSRHRSKYTG